MKETEKEHIPNVKKQGWSAREIIEQGANEESDEVVEKITHGDKAKKDKEKRSLVDILFPTERTENSDHVEGESSVPGSEKENSGNKDQ